MMAYNPAIGRVLERDGVGMFRNPYRGRRAWAFGSRDDVFHSETCERIIRTFKTNRKRDRVQAVEQVFAKIAALDFLFPSFCWWRPPRGTSTCMEPPAPTGSRRCSSSARRTLACVRRLMSPTSSRKIVPPSALALPGGGRTAARRLRDREQAGQPFSELAEGRAVGAGLVGAACDAADDFSKSRGFGNRDGEERAVQGAGGAAPGKGYEAVAMMEPPCFKSRPAVHEPLYVFDSNQVGPPRRL